MKVDFKALIEQEKERAAAAKQEEEVQAQEAAAKAEAEAKRAQEAEVAAKKEEVREAAAAFLEENAYKASEEGRSVVEDANEKMMAVDDDFGEIKRLQDGLAEMALLAADIDEENLGDAFKEGRAQAQQELEGLMEEYGAVGELLARKYQLWDENSRLKQEMIDDTEVDHSERIAQIALEIKELDEQINQHETPWPHSSLDGHDELDEAVREALSGIEAEEAAVKAFEALDILGKNSETLNKEIEEMEISDGAKAQLKEMAAELIEEVDKWNIQETLKRIADYHIMPFGEPDVETYRTELGQLNARIQRADVSDATKAKLRQAVDRGIDQAVKDLTLPMHFNDKNTRLKTLRKGALEALSYYPPLAEYIESKGEKAAPAFVKSFEIGRYSNSGDVLFTGDKQRAKLRISMLEGLDKSLGEMVGALEKIKTYDDATFGWPATRKGYVIEYREAYIAFDRGEDHHGNQYWKEHLEAKLKEAIGNKIDYSHKSTMESFFRALEKKTKGGMEAVSGAITVLQEARETYRREAEYLRNYESEATEVMWQIDRTRKGTLRQFNLTTASKFERLSAMKRVWTDIAAAA